MGNGLATISAIALAIVGLAVIAVLVSNKANTANVFGAAGNAFSQAIGAAVSPVTGAGIGGSTLSSHL